MDPQPLKRISCRACGQPLRAVLTLGDLRLNDFPRRVEDLQEARRVPITLTACDWCGLAQLQHTTPLDWLYRHYWYKSGVNESMIEELHDVVQEACARVTLSTEDAVLDIGANDGTLLGAYSLIAKVVPYRVAVEPALNLTDRLRSRANEVHATYFPCDLSHSFKVITAIACAYDVEDPVGFFTEIRKHLAKDGIAIVQFQDLRQMLQATAFDNICHEHLEYYSLNSLLMLADLAGLMVVGCSTRAINGGSLRVILTHAKGTAAGKLDASVLQQLNLERQAGLASDQLRHHREPFDRFRVQVQRMQGQIRAVIDQAIEEHLVVDAYGASTKGNILLQVLGLGPGQIRRAIDRSPEKVGCYTITGIPIVGEVDGRRHAADLWLVPIWQFRESVFTREGWFLEQGGRMVFPLPRVEVVQQGWQG